MNDLTHKIDKFVKIILKYFKRSLNNIFVKYFPVTLSDKKFLDLTEYNSFNDVINEGISGNFFFDPSNKGKMIQTIEKEYPQLIQNSIKDAEGLYNHFFDLLGSGKIKLDTIDWHIDFKSGFKWSPKKYYLDSSEYMNYFKDGFPADIKVPWELSRCQHFATLGKAYWYTKDEKYAQEFIDEINSWIDNNPVEIGVNWICAMDVAIRAVNWIWGYYFFSDSKKLTEEFKIKLLKNLFLHGRFIWNHLEYESQNNHYLSNLTGLIYLGIFFKETEEGRKWLDEGVSSIKEEMKHQVYPDGVDYEASISYHRLATELFASATILCFKNDIKLPNWYMKRLERMFEFIHAYTKPDGKAPQIGDTDDGRLQILSDYGNWDRTDHRFLLPLGAKLFNRSDFMIKDSKMNEEAFWLFGGYNKDFNKDINNIRLGSAAFPDGGIYIMQKNDIYMIINCLSPNANIPQGHRHNDILSFELFAYDKSFIIDPGSYIYTANKNMRNLFRSTRYHNVIVVDDEEQNNFKENELFDMGIEAKVKINNWESTDKYDLLDIEHNGYERLKDQVIHRRQIYFDKKDNYFLINDILETEGKHKFDLYFHFAPLKLKIIEDSIVESNFCDGVNLAIIPLKTEGLSVEVKDGLVSYSYGNKKGSSILKYSKDSKGKTNFINLIYPYKSGGDLESIIKNKKLLGNRCFLK